MNNIKSLRNFGTIYLWIFAIKVLQVCGDVEYRTDTDAVDKAADITALLMKPYAYQIFDDDYTDELLNERNTVATPLWRTLNKQQQLYFNGKRLPLITTKIKAKSGNSMTSKGITFENLNALDSYKIKNTIWPKVISQEQQEKQQQQHQQHDLKVYSNNDNDSKQRRHSLQEYFFVQSSSGDGIGVAKPGSTMTNSHYKQNQNVLLPIPIIMKKYFKTKNARTIKRAKTAIHDADININKGVAGSAENDDDIKENLFPPKDDSTSNANDGDDDDGVWYENEDKVGVGYFAGEANGIANSNGNGNESLNYANNNEANTNYMMAQSSHTDHDRDSHKKQQYTGLNVNEEMKRIINKPHDKRAKPSIGHTPFLPAVSGGAMTNLGKFFRDLSKNVHVSEHYQWDADKQKLLEGDPHFGDMQHHLTKPNAATDQQTAEWIKAIRFYRPSQKIRSLVEMNPHGQWAHSSQFIDPNYMWVGLGK